MLKGIVAGFLTGLIVLGLLGVAVAAAENAFESGLSENQNPTATDIISNVEDTNDDTSSDDGPGFEDVEDEIEEEINSNDEITDDVDPDDNTNTDLSSDNLDVDVETEVDDDTDLISDEIVEDETDVDTNLVDSNGGGSGNDDEIAEDEEEEESTFCGQPDVNGNEVVDMADILAVLTAWGTNCGESGCPEDVNEDGVVGDADLQCVLDHWEGQEEPAECVHSSDVNSDQIVNMQDILDVLSNWGLCNVFDCPWDITGEGKVDEDDIACVLKDWSVDEGEDDPIETGNAQSDGGSGGGGSSSGSEEDEDEFFYVNLEGNYVDRRFGFDGFVELWEYGSGSHELKKVYVYNEGVLVDLIENDLETFDAEIEFLNNPRFVALGN